MINGLSDSNLRQIDAGDKTQLRGRCSTWEAKKFRGGPDQIWEAKKFLVGFRSNQGCFRVGDVIPLHDDRGNLKRWVKISEIWLEDVRDISPKDLVAMGYEKLHQFWYDWLVYVGVRKKACATLYPFFAELFDNHLYFRDVFDAVAIEFELTTFPSTTDEAISPLDPEGDRFYIPVVCSECSGQEFKDILSWENSGVVKRLVYCCQCSKVVYSYP